MAPSNFRELAIAELDAVYRMALHLARDAERAQDLVQETYLRALGAQDRFELREAGIRPWLFKILHNCFYSELARQKRAPAASEAMDDHPADGPGSGDGQDAPAWDLASLDWEQVDDRLKRAIDDLPEHYRLPLLLWAVEGLKYREIAEVLGVALGTVMSRLYRARAVLSNQLRDLAKEKRMRVEE